MLNDFVSSVKQECVVDRDYFILFDIPDLIVKKKLARKDYEQVIKIVNKVKTRYIAEKLNSKEDIKNMEPKEKEKAIA